jgi:acyl-CoA thioesterase
MTVYFHADQADLAATGGDFVLCEAHALAFRNGHSDQSARLWSATGTLLATTHQLVYYKD